MNKVIATPHTLTPFDQSRAIDRAAIESFNPTHAHSTFKPTRGEIWYVQQLARRCEFAAREAACGRGSQRWAEWRAHAAVRLAQRVAARCGRAKAGEA